MRIYNKSEWYELFNANLFNRTLMYTQDEFIKLDVEESKNKIWCIRNTKIANAPFEEVKYLRLLIMIAQKELNKDEQIAEKAPDESIIIQGNYRGDLAEITFEKEAMGILLRAKDFYKKPWKQISRLQLIDIIGYESINYMNELIEIYNAKENSTNINDAPIIEFSYYDKPVGIHNKRLIIWEIRHY